MPQVPVRPSLAITAGAVAAAPSSKSEIMPGLTAQPLRPGGTTVPPPPGPEPAVLPEPPVVPLVPPAPGPEPPAPTVPMQTPPEQVWPTAQATPHALQLAASVSRLTHAAPQSVLVQVDEHVPFEQ